MTSIFGHPGNAVFCQHIAKSVLKIPGTQKNWIVFFLIQNNFQQLEL